MPCSMLMKRVTPRTPHRVENRAMVFFFFPSLFFFSSFHPIFDQNAKTTILIKKRGEKMTLFCHFMAFFFLIERLLFFDRKAPLFDQKFSLFSSKCSPFSHHGECGPHIFVQRRYRPTSYQVARDLRKYTQTYLFLSFFRQTGTGPRPTHCGPQGKSELCVQRADSTSDRWSLSLRRERESS